MKHQLFLKLNDAEISMFQKKNFMHTEKMVKGHKVTCNYSIYYSSEYKLTTRTCSYIIEYKEAETLKYGKIDYFLSAEVTYAIITNLLILETNFLYNLNLKTTKRNRELQQGFFNTSFKIVEWTSDKFIIMCKDIITEHEHD